MEKICLKCEKLLPLEKFGKNKKSKDGHFYRCIECEKKRKKDFYEDGYKLIMSERQESRKPYNRFYHNNMNIFKCRFRTAKQRARKKGFEFDLTLDYLFELYNKQNGICYITGVKLSLEKHHHNTISIDRIDSKKGYVVSNIGICTDFINIAKSNYELDELLNILREIKEFATL